MNLSYDLTKIIIILTLFNLSHHQLYLYIFLSPNEKDQRLRPRSTILSLVIMAYT